MKKRIVWFCCCFVVCSYMWAGRMSVSASDSTEVVNLLKQAQGVLSPQDLPLFFAKKLINRPYVSATLEVNKEECLVVNLRELDCTTLVENVVALTLSALDGKCDLSTFCRYLEQIRYQDGYCHGYASRNHYFSEWIDSNERLGLVTEITDAPGVKQPVFTGRQKIDLHYMSSHPEKYPMLKGKPETIRQIRANENRVNGKVVAYLPSDKLNWDEKRLLQIKNGDILALVTKKDGLDISHVGFAVWIKGRLHLLNASSLHKKVVLEPMTLWQYFKKHPSNIGIRVIRINM